MTQMYTRPAGRESRRASMSKLLSSAGAVAKNQQSFRRCARVGSQRIGKTVQPRPLCGKKSAA